MLFTFAVVCWLFRCASFDLFDDFWLTVCGGICWVVDLLFCDLFAVSWFVGYLLFAYGCFLLFGLFP